MSVHSNGHDVLVTIHAMGEHNSAFQEHGENPLLSDSPRMWGHLVQSVGPASLLVAIDNRLGMSLRRTHSPEDILQEALLQAWNSRATYEWRGLKSFRAWLLRIIDNRIRDAADHQSALKRGGKAVAISLEHPGSQDSSGLLSVGMFVPAALVDSTTPSRLAMYREQAAAIQQALSDLPEDVRDVVRLRLVEQLPLESIAQSLGLGVAAVRHRFRKGAEIYHRRLNLTAATRPNLPMHRNSDSAPLHDGISAPSEE